jgi:DNA-binding GntR family transcriptional regulator
MARRAVPGKGGARAQETSHVDRVYDQLKRSIVEGQYRSGEALTEGTLARTQRASRTPVREALSRLHQEGLVDRLPGRGWFVSTVTVQLIRDTFEVRRWLEGATAAGAAERASDAALHELRALGEFRYADASYRSAEQINREFHLAIARAAGNQVAIDLVQQCLTQFDRFLSLGSDIRPSPYAENATAEHLKIVAAIERREPAGARAAMEHHLDACGELMMQALTRGSSLRGIGF